MPPFKIVFEVNPGSVGNGEEDVSPHLLPLPLTVSPCTNSCGSDNQTQSTFHLFVILDHLGTPFPNVQATFSQDRRHTWDSLAIPEDHFDLAFEVLPCELSGSC